MAKTVLSMVKTRLKSKSKPRKTKNMAKRKSGKRKGSRRSSGGGLGSVGGVFKKPVVQHTALALGLGTVGALLAARVAPQYTQIASLAVPYFGGAGIEGIIGAEVVKAFAGAPSILSGFGGMGASAPMGMMA